VRIRADSQLIYDIAFQKHYQHRVPIVTWMPDTLRRHSGMTYP